MFPTLFSAARLALPAGGGPLSLLLPVAAHVIANRKITFSLSIG